MLVEISYLGPTDTKGSRLKAKCNQGSIIVNYDYGVEDDTRSLNAAIALWCKYNKDTIYKYNTMKVVGYLNNKTYVKIDVIY